MLVNPWSRLSKRWPQTTRLLVLPLFLLGLLGFLINTDIPFHSTSPDTCLPKSNVVFLKTHKCAGSSVQNIFLRYGDAHGLRFALPRAGNYLGHPQPFNRSMVEPRRRYNILAHHTRLDYGEIRAVMPPDSVFVTIVRNPVEVFESSFSYYDFAKAVRGNIHQYLARAPLMSSARLHRRIQHGKLGTNQMMFDLGADPAIFPNDTLVRRYIDRLDGWFDLVLVADRMDESLVLLRHLMCWDLDRVVAFRLNARARQFVSNLTEDERSRLRYINRADVLLYEHFSRRFEAEVEAFGREKMREEVEVLRQRTRSWYQLCVAGQQRYQRKPKEKPKYFYNPKVLVFEASDERNSTCRAMTNEELAYTDELRKRQMGNASFVLRATERGRTDSSLPLTGKKAFRNVIKTN